MNDVPPPSRLRTDSWNLGHELFKSSSVVAGCS
jgi:hypothetical protein